ncbi:MAG: M67 family metallopeptidase [Planctomycetota bacterium]|jgi:proteasome lid subunit RPN8/RPN11
MEGEGQGFAGETMDAVRFCSEVEVSGPEPGLRPVGGAMFQVRPLGDASSTACPVFVSREALEQAVEFSRCDLAREQGGFLVGGRFVEGGEEFIWVRKFVEGRGIEGRAASARFTADSFGEAWRSIEVGGPYDYSPLLLGWFHTHPGLGAFLSDADRFIHENFFDLPFLVAMVADPVREELLLYRWREGELRSSGFHLVNRIPPREPGGGDEHEERESGISGQ